MSSFVKTLTIYKSFTSIYVHTPEPTWRARLDDGPPHPLVVLEGLHLADGPGASRA